MLNWNTDEKKLKRSHPRQYQHWKLIQHINFGLDGKKLNEKELKSAWPAIKPHLNPDRRKVLEFLLWNKPWRGESGLLPNRSNYWIWRAKKHIL